MPRAVSFKAHVKRALLPLLGLALAGYFAYHAVIGDYGLLALQRMQHEAAELETELAALKAQRAEMEHRVSLMRPESLDPDMLDERARETLNLSHPHDITVMRTNR